MKSTTIINIRNQSKIATLAVAAGLLLAASTNAKAQNYIRDSSFELQTSSTVASPWQVDKTIFLASGTASIQRSLRTSLVGNNNALLVNPTVNWLGLRQTVAGLTPLGRYRLEGWIKCSANVVSGYFGVRGVKQTIFGGPTFANYKFVAVDFTLGSGTSIVVFAGFYGPGTSASVQLDNLILRPIDSTMNVVDDPSFENQTSKQSLNAPWVAVGTYNSGAGVEMGLGTSTSGSKNAWLSAHSGWNEINQKISVQEGASYKATMNIQTSANFRGGYFGLRRRYSTTSNGVVYLDRVAVAPSGTYQTVTLFFTGSAWEPIDGDTMLELYIGYTAPDASSWMRIDNVNVSVVSGLPTTTK